MALGSVQVKAFPPAVSRQVDEPRGTVVLRSHHQKLQRSAHHNVKELPADILDWADTWNQNPQPFVWTKTAEQILERLAGYCVIIKTIA